VARLPRLTLAGSAHYVTQATVHGQLLALDDDDRRSLLNALAGAAQQHAVAVWGYVLLPQALHLLVCPPTGDALGRLMQTLGRRYVGAFNRRHARQGALWAGRFRAAVVEPGEWTLTALCRIDQLGLAQAQGTWSSALHHLGQQRQPLMSDPPELWALGNTPFERETRWSERLAQPLDPTTLDTLARAVHGDWVVGSEAFAAGVAGAIGRPARPRRPGRPARAHPETKPV
jgi:putative transposase